VPDREPPADWNIERDLSIIRKLRRANTAWSWDDVAFAIQGAAILRDNPGKYLDASTLWIKRGEKMTMRALYSDSGKVGARPLFRVAIDVFHQHHTQTRGPTSLGDVLAQAQRRAES